MTKLFATVKTEYYPVDLEKFKENPEQNLMLILEALELQFSNTSVNYEKLKHMLKLDSPVTYE